MDFLDWTRPVLTQGDPAGIGPEVWVSLWPELSNFPLLVGDRVVMQAAIDRFAPTLRLVPPDQRGGAGEIPLLDTQTLLELPPVGMPSRASGLSSYASLQHALAWLTQHSGCLVTAPISKEAWGLAGINEPGHTEVLARHAQRDVAMMLANDELSVVLATIHLSLRDAIDALDQACVERAIAFADGLQVNLGRRPKIAVAGLNPHAGEAGKFGREEIEFIAPAVAAMRAGGLDVHGPYAPDTVFMRARQGEFDVVVALYHDQGLIPVKYLGVEAGVNVTLGLPFVRTSPDHGTAFDIAWQGRASTRATAYAFKRALLLCTKRA